MRAAIGWTFLICMASAAEPDPLERALRMGGDRPDDLRFALRLAGDRSVFRPGEPIVFELAFQARTPHKYRVQGSPEPWFPMSSIDLFDVDPKSSEELSGAELAVGAGMSWMGSLAPVAGEEVVVRVEANQVLRLREPGTYRVRLATRRVTRLDGAGTPYGAGEPLCLISEPVRITLTEPDPDWEREQLNALLAELDDEPAPGGYPRTQIQAATRLGYLTIPEAADAMVDRMGWQGHQTGYALWRGLRGAPHRERLLERLEAGIEAPGQAVSERYITTLTELQGHFQGLRQSEEDRRRYWREMGVLRNAVHHRLAKALTTKTEAARASSLKTLLIELTTSGPASVGEGRLDWERFRSTFAALLPELPRTDQEEALSNHWEAVRHPSLRAYLRETVESGDGANPEDQPTEVYSPQNRLRRIALMRLSDLAPQEARRIVLREAGRANPTIEAAGLAHLPDEVMPEIEPAVLATLRDPGGDRNRALTLLERYATESALDEVREIESAWLAEGQTLDACSTNAALLAYYLRVDEEHGLQRIAALAQPAGFDSDACRIGMLRRLVELHASPRLEEIVRPMLNDPSPVVVGQAAGWLAQHGSASVAELIWKRFEAFHAEWRGREDELAALRRAGDLAHDPRQMEMGLSSALISLDRSEEARLRVVSLCVTEECRRNMGGGESWRDASAVSAR